MSHGGLALIHQLAVRIMIMLFKMLDAYTGSDVTDKILKAKDRHAGAIPGENDKIGRNAPCPCGSGKKYKKCCMDSQLDF